MDVPSLGDLYQAARGLTIRYRFGKVLNLLLRDKLVPRSEEFRQHNEIGFHLLQLGGHGIEIPGDLAELRIILIKPDAHRHPPHFTRKRAGLFSPARSKKPSHQADNYQMYAVIRLFHFGQMHHRGVGMFCARIGMPGLAVFYGFLQMFAPLIQMRVFHSGSLRMLERFLRMLDTGIGMSLLPMVCGSFRMLNGFTDMLGRPSGGSGRAGWSTSKAGLTQHRHSDKRPYRGHNQRTSTDPVNHCSLLPR
jgi:hypothetical protein